MQIVQSWETILLSLPSGHWKVQHLSRPSTVLSVFTFRHNINVLKYLFRKTMKLLLSLDEIHDNFQRWYMIILCFGIMYVCFGLISSKTGAKGRERCYYYRPWTGANYYQTGQHFSIVLFLAFFMDSVFIFSIDWVCSHIALLEASVIEWLIGRWLQTTCPSSL
jgi:hypothetical protein